MDGTEVTAPEVHDYATAIAAGEDRFDAGEVEKVLDDALARASHTISVGTPAVVQFAEVYPSDAPGLNMPPERLAFGSSPDMAVIMSGGFLMPRGFAGLGVPPTPKVRAFVLVVVDRQTGQWVQHLASDDLAYLSAMLPE
jgi:hypothetical protein